KARERREILDQEIADALADLKKDQQRLAKREDTLDKKLESLTEREKSLDRRDSQLKKLEDELAAMRVELEQARAIVKKRLQEISGLTEQQAREIFLEEVRRESTHEANVLKQQIMEEAEVEARTRSREITLQAIQRFAAEHVAD